MATGYQEHKPLLDPTSQYKQYQTSTGTHTGNEKQQYPPEEPPPPYQAAYVPFPPPPLPQPFMNQHIPAPNEPIVHPEPSKTFGTVERRLLIAIILSAIGVFASSFLSLVCTLPAIYCIVVVVNSNDADKRDKYSKQAIYGGVCALISGIISFVIFLSLFLVVRFAAAVESSTTSPETVESIQ